MNRTLALLLTLLALGCSGSPSEPPAPPPTAEGGEEAIAERPRREPPASAPARDVSLPPITRTSLANGLEVNAVPTTSAFPLVYVRLVIRSGFAADPAELPGLAGLVANMLKEGTRTRSSAEIAETIEYLGADLQVGIDPMQTGLTIRGTADQVDAMLDILADVVMNPRFEDAELTRLKRRELERLTVGYGDASVVARREFYRAIYGAHPYNHVDATPDAIERARQRDLTSFHRTHYVPGNAFLVIAGAVTPEAARASAERAFGRWRRRPVPTLRLPELPARTGREVIVVHRPGSPQSVINIGNLALARNDADWIPLEVANEILGGSASARLFMDLRERRSLTYGAYSGVDELAVPGPFRARGGIGRDPAQPELDRTGLAMDAFMEHLVRITAEAPSADEVRDATQYLSDSFPLSIDTIGRVAWMVGYLRIFGLPDDYWDTYRSAIRAVTPEQALAAARAHIDPENALVVVVGDATTVAPLMRRWGPVRVIDIDDGHEISRFDMEPAPAAP